MMEKDKIKEFIGKAEYIEKYGFIVNSEVGAKRPFAYIYPNKEFDVIPVGHFITDAINAALHSKPEIDLREVERLLKGYSKAAKIIEGLMFNEKDLEGYWRNRIGYSIEDLPAQGESKNSKTE